MVGLLVALGIGMVLFVGKPPLPTKPGTIPDDALNFTFAGVQKGEQLNAKLSYSSAAGTSIDVSVDPHQHRSGIESLTIAWRGSTGSWMCFPHAGYVMEWSDGVETTLVTIRYQDGFRIKDGRIAGADERPAFGTWDSATTFEATTVDLGDAPDFFFADRPGQHGEPHKAPLLGLTCQTVADDATPPDADVLVQAWDGWRRLATPASDTSRFPEVLLPSVTVLAANVDVPVDVEVRVPDSWQHVEGDLGRLYPNANATVFAPNPREGAQSVGAKHLVFENQNIARADDSQRDLDQTLLGLLFGVAVGIATSIPFDGWVRPRRPRGRAPADR
ncbi:MAG: hypothetical protein QM598_01965 [Protaetiibacter sp.]